MKYENAKMDFEKGFFNATPETVSFESQDVVISRVRDAATIGSDGSVSIAKKPCRVEWRGGAEHIAGLDGADMRVYDGTGAHVFSGRVSLKFGPDVSRNGDVAFDVIEL